MSKTGQWVFEMQEDACQMTLAEFVEKHGYSAAEVWHEMQIGSMEPDYEAMAEGYYGS